MTNNRTDGTGGGVELDSFGVALTLTNSTVDDNSAANAGVGLSVNGGSARLTVTVGTDAHADLTLEAHVISPWGTWEWIGPAARGAVLPARGSVELSFDVAPPTWVEPGEWWALIRVGCAGRLVYSPAAKVTVR